MKDTLVLSEFLPFRLNRLAAEVSERMAAIYAERFGLDIAQWRVLATLSAARACTAQEIVAATRTHKSTISRAVQELEIKKLIARSINGSDRRAHTLQLTPYGRKLFRQLQPLVLNFEAELLAKLSPAEAKALLRGIGAAEGALGLAGEATT